MKLLSIGAAVVPATLVMAAFMAPAPLPAGDALLKCAPPAGWTQADLHHVIDGRFRKPISTGRMRSDRPYLFEDIEITVGILDRVEVLCWDPAKQVLQRNTGEPAVYMTTEPFMATLRADLERIVAAQVAHRRTHSDYATEIADLDVAMQTDGMTYTLTRSGDGWEATATSNMLIETCHVFAGAIESPRDGLVERTPACFVRPEFELGR